MKAKFITILLSACAAMGVLSAARPAFPETTASELLEKASSEFKNGDYTSAQELYKEAREALVTGGEADKADEARLGVYASERVLFAYPYSEDDAKKMLAESFSDIPEEERNAWLSNGRADFLDVYGTKCYFEDFIKNLKYRDVTLASKDEEMIKREGTFLRAYRDIIFRPAEENPLAPAWEPYLNPVTFEAAATLTIKREQLPKVGILKLWVPLPVQTAAQDEIVVASIVPQEYVVTVPRTDGDIGMVYMEVPLEKLTGDLNIAVEFSFRHYEQRFEVNPDLVGEYDKESALYKEYTRPYKNTGITPAIKALAEEITAGEKNPYLAARKIFDYVVSGVKYSYMPHVTLNALGKPESVFVHENKFGDCGAQSCYFSALCRAAGIPARTTGGMQLCPEETSTHFWAEFYMPNYGWLPVDTSIAQTVDYTDEPEDVKKAFKDYYFGNQDPYRFVIQKDIDVPLAPDPKESIAMPMALQFPAAVCKGCESDPVGLMAEGWKIDIKKLDQ